MNCQVIINSWKAATSWLPFFSSELYYVFKQQPHTVILVTTSYPWKLRLKCVPAQPVYVNLYQGTCTRTRTVFYRKISSILSVSKLLNLLSIYFFIGSLIRYSTRYYYQYWYKVSGLWLYFIMTLEVFFIIKSGKPLIMCYCLHISVASLPYS